MIPSIFRFQTILTGVTVAACAAALLAGCATASKDVGTAYVSPLQYQNYDCEQLGIEAQRLQVRANQLAGQLDSAADADKALTAVGMVLFWPALFALGGTKEEEAEYARLKGEYEAIQQTAVAKKCAVIPSPIAPAPPSPAEQENS